MGPMFWARISGVFIITGGVLAYAWAQSGGGFIPGQTLASVELNAAFATKRDLNTSPINPVAPPYNADATGSVDSTTVINAALAASGWVQLPCGTFKISTLVINNNNTRFSGSGLCTKLTPSVASVDAILIGNGSVAPLNAIVENFKLWPLQQMTGGCAIRARGIARSRFDRVYIGTQEDQQANGNWFNNGLCMSGFDLTTFTNGQIVGGAGEAIQLSQSLTFNYGVAFYLDAPTLISNWGSNCIHLGGGAGGVNIDSQATQACGGWVILVDKTLFNAGNSQLFLGPNFAGESGASGILKVDTAAMPGGTLACFGCWLSGSGGGPGVQINSGSLLTAKFTGAHIIANFSHGIHTQDGGILAVNGPTEVVANGNAMAAHGIFIDAVGTSAQINISGGPQILNNGVGGSGWGIFQSGATPTYQLLDGLTLTGNSQGAISGIGAVGHTVVCGNLVYAGSSSC